MKHFLSSHWPKLFLVGYLLLATGVYIHTKLPPKKPIIYDPVDLSDKPLPPTTTPSPYINSSHHLTYKNSKYQFRFTYSDFSDPGYGDEPWSIVDTTSEFSLGKIVGDGHIYRYDFHFYPATKSDKNNLLGWWKRVIKHNPNYKLAPTDIIQPNFIEFVNCIQFESEIKANYPLPPSLDVRTKSVEPAAFDSGSVYLYYDFGTPFVIEASVGGTGACGSNDEYLPYRTITALSTDSSSTSLNNTTTHVFPQHSSYSIPNSSYPTVKNITLPKFNHLPQNILAKVNKTLNFSTITGTTLSEVKTNQYGITDVDYQVTYDQHNLLSIVYLVQTLGAYPSTNVQNYTLNLTTGQFIKASDLFISTKISDLLPVLNAKLQININQAKNADCPLESELQSQKENNPNYGKFDAKNLDFRLTSDGIEFVYTFGFPHVMLACEPNGVVFLSYAELKPYLNPSGPLSFEIK